MARFECRASEPRLVCAWIWQIECPVIHLVCTWDKKRIVLKSRDQYNAGENDGGKEEIEAFLRIGTLEYKSDMLLMECHLLYLASASFRASFIAINSFLVTMSLKTLTPRPVKHYTWTKRVFVPLSKGRN